MRYIVRGVVFDSRTQMNVYVWYAGDKTPHRVRFMSQYDVTFAQEGATSIDDKVSANAARDLMDGSRWNGQRINSVSVEICC